MIKLCRTLTLQTGSMGAVVLLVRPTEIEIHATIRDGGPTIEAVAKEFAENMAAQKSISLPLNGTRIPM